MVAIIEAVGERKRVLVVGCAQRALLPKHLTDRQCDVVVVDADPALLEAARPFCTRTVRADLGADSLATVLDGYACDALVFNGALEHLRDPAKVLEDARGLLLDGGFLVACVPNVAHGAVRLALLSGRFDYAEGGVLDQSHVRFFTAKSIDELLLGAGYSLQSTTRVSAPIFDGTSAMPRVERSDYSEEVVANIERDAESQTAQFVVKAIPFSNEARYRAIGKRFLEVNTELASALQRVESLGRSRERAEASLAERSAELAAVRAEHQRLAQQRDESSTSNGALTAKVHALELDIVRREERLHFTELRLEDTRSTYEARVTDLLSEIAELREHEPSAEVLAPLNDRIRQLIGERDHLLEKQREVTRQAELLATQRAALATERDELKQWREVLIAKVSSLEEDLLKANALAERAESERDSAMLETLVKDDEVAAYAAARADAEAIAAQVRREAAAARASLAKTTAALKSAEAARAAIAHDPIALSQGHAELASAKVRMSRLRSESAVAAQVSLNGRSLIDDLRDRVSALQNAIAITNADNTRTRAESKLEILAAVRRAERAEATATTLSKRNQELSLQFMQHVRELTASTLKASSEVASLIDATQASKPWAFKAFLRRVFRRTQ